MFEAAQAGAPTHLTVLLQEFAQTDAARVCADPAGAYANCLAMSALCAEWLRARGVQCGIVWYSGSREPFPEAAGRWPYCDLQEISHWTVRAGDWSIDWTARQFQAQADWPDVRHVDSMAARWQRVQGWACDRCQEFVADPRHRELTPSRLDVTHRELALATGGRGPFADPRHDATTALVALCSCDRAPARR